jgi:ArsR family transcriptional regulator, arsenate/arsenite/antimonite-responsive transcriptional repressor
MKCKSYDNFFLNFANRTKLGIILLLRHGPLNVKSIAESVKEEQSTVSHNLRKLTACNILEVKKAGKERIYSLNKDTVMPILELVEKHVEKHCPKTCSRM